MLPPCSTSRNGLPFHRHTPCLLPWPLCTLALLWCHSNLYCYHSLGTPGSSLFFKYWYIFPSQTLPSAWNAFLPNMNVAHSFTSLNAFWERSPWLSCIKKRFLSLPPMSLYVASRAECLWLPPNSYVEALIRQCDDIWRWGLCRRVRSGGGALIDGISALIRRGVSKPLSLPREVGGG